MVSDPARGYSGLMRQGRLTRWHYLIGLIGLVLVGVGGFTAFAWRPAIAPITRPAPAGFPAGLVARGSVLASAGYCATCHTAAGGKPFAGSYAMATQFGTIYSSNITPDEQTGIGGWSEAAFRRAMREGVSRDGSHLFPAFPYDHFNKLTDDDIRALYAFFMTRTPVSASPPANTVPFPLNIRALQAGWKLLFFRPRPFTPDTAKSPEWNRGAYLVQGLSHCGACHTPRNWLGAERRNRALTGATIDGWVAPPLDASNPSPVGWDEAELIAYLGTGVSRFHGTAAGPMAPVTRGLAALPPRDLQAIAVYLSTFNGTAGRAVNPAPAVAKVLAEDHAAAVPTYDPAARLYEAACASCHYNADGQVNPLRPALALTSAVTLDDPTNLIQVILHGVPAQDGAPGVVMPGFSRFSDADVARIAAYLRARAGKAPWPDLEKHVADVRVAETSH